MENKEVILSVKDLNVKFSLRGKVLHAIRGISLDLYKGESLAIVGESGSGKSVFTKNFIGLLDKNGWVDSGEILYYGRDPEHPIDLAKLKTEQDWFGIRGKEVAMVMQDPMTSLNPLKTIGWQIGEALKLIIVITLTGTSYKDYNAGASWLSYLLTPATVCLAVPLYQQMELLKKNYRAIISGITAGVLSSLTSILLLALLFGWDHASYATFLPKSITTAIGMGVSEELGGIVPITVVAIIITGVLGNIFAESFLKLLHIKELCANQRAHCSSF